MPPSEGSNESYISPPGQTLAVVTETLYLLNLLLIPGLAFIALVIIYLRNVRTASPLALCHLRQTLSASIWAGFILIVMNALIIAFGGYDAPYTWTFVLLYFTACHSTLILLGTLGLAKAMAGKAWCYPLVGRPCPELQMEERS